MHLGSGLRLRQPNNKGSMKTKDPTKQQVPENKPPYKSPELKKHGKLKNKATQVSTYTYTYIT
jgi:hypothetical protein